MVENGTIPERLFRQGAERPESPAYFVMTDGRWQATRWKSHVAEVRQAARALIALGLEPGCTVAILGFNRPEWLVMDLAAMCIGGAAAGVYTSSSPEEVQYVVGHAESMVILVENHAQWTKVKSQREKLPGLKRVVLMKGAEAIDDPWVLTWEAFMALADGVDEPRVDERVKALEPSGLATLIYTSGTTGPPKGVMLSHRNLAWTADVAMKITSGGPDDVTLSYLPLSHIAEQMFTVHGPTTSGIAVYFAESLEKFPENLKSVQPTVFFGVPRIWEKFQAGAAAKLAQATGAKKLVAEWAMKVGRRVNLLRCEGRPLPGLLELQYRLATALFYNKVKAALGLGRARICVSGAAPVAPEVLEFFMGIDLVVLEVYGQSEGTGPTSFNQPGRTKLGTVGPAIPGVEVKLGDDGEVLVKGPNVFPGYYKDPEATREALTVDGWLCSGDLGEFDSDGYLSITGRKKDILITSGGKNITPKNIEGALKNHQLIGEAVLVGDRRNYLTVLLTLEPEAAARFASAHGVAADNIATSELLRAEVQRAIDEVNSKLAKVETVKKFAVLPRSFDIEHGELTPTLKVKRRVVYQNWSAQIEAMYQTELTEPTA